MSLTEFNRAADGDARAQLQSCLRVSRWVDGLSARRPFSSVEEALELAHTIAHPLTEEEIDEALAGHPRIGDRDDSDTAEAAHSRREQGGLGDADAEILRRLDAGNRAYEERFGRVFLIRAAGRTHQEVLTELERRLDLDPAQELEIIGQQLEEIAALRLEGLLR
ncbi:2-oxo-4-hydroxy-4-carboxy-5-ureidoimidazoline decarboxylase [Nesterenkonia sp. CL21]|uniref:2-oxo-4-hydroxy-4-carboxy-5-ureidoimidazoline decarboxylase n=1 Tax=Nesterenkonia sp. CL21 TaxID=3064894 RepID=UPI00287A1D25|nr:2-oxo-4-hydroxy-4-carboxy-5-ureidoimidazoline decarboxylase [Nesterenkonia sp. CL21]MDS2174338.1 2-oxo-4-hydroxy-4-carboxy-5-ureidoimidazoline decarboxylase [Nesterenkonia sp. CL21]